MQVIFQQGGEHARHGEAGAVDGVHEFRFAVGIAETNLRAAGLERLETRAARHLQPALLTGRPDFEVVFFGLRKSDVAATHEEHAVGQLEFLQEALGIETEGVELGVAGLGMHPLEQLDLVELVEAVEPAHVLAVAARLAAETRRVGGAFHRQRLGVENLVAEEVRQRHLGGRHCVETIGDGLIHLTFLVGQLAGGGGAGGVDEDRRVNLGVAGGDSLIQKELKQSAHDAGAVADVEGEARAGDLRAATEVYDFIEAGNFPVRLGDRRVGVASAPGGEGDVVVGGAALGHAGVREVGQREHRGAVLGLDFSQAGLARLHLGGHGLHLLHLNDKLGRTLGELGHLGVGGLLFAAQILDLDELAAPGGVEREHGIEIYLEVFLGDGGADEIRGFAEELGIEHGGEV